MARTTHPLDNVEKDGPFVREVQGRHMEVKKGDNWRGYEESQSVDQ